MKQFYLLLFSSILTLAPLAKSDASVPGWLTLEEIIRIVRTGNPAIESARHKWEALRARVPQAAAWDDLKISADSRVTRFVSIPPDAFTDQMLTVEQMIPLSGKNRSRARIAAAEALVAFEEVRRQQFNVITQARASYFRLANLYAQIDLNRKSFVSLQQIADVTRSKYEVGTQTAADVFVAENEASKLLATRRDLERALAGEQSQLNVLMNRDAFTPMGKPDDVSAIRPPSSLSELRAFTFAHRPEIKMAAAKIAGEKARLQLAHRDWIPDPAINVRAQRYNSSAQTASEVDAGVSFSVPWFNHQKYSAETTEADENLRAAELELQRAQVEAVGLLRDQLQKIETMHHHVELFREKILPQAQQAYEATRLGYESGKSGFLEWITTQRNLRDVEAMARQNLADYQVAVAELDRVVGVELRPSSASQ
jgi:cobalt-zinc-cadmium efflux system outer membrane protein